MMKAQKKLQHARRKRMYMVCCAPRIVLCGWATPTEIRTAHPTLTDVRMLVYWDVSMRGLHGVAKHGPGPHCRVTPAAGEQQVRTTVEAVFPVDDAARRRWEAEPWA